MKQLFVFILMILISSNVLAQLPFEDEEANTFEGGFGITWIDDTPYTTFSITPDLTFGKFGVGLNIELLFNNQDGFKFRKTGWDKGAGILRAIRYLRYGHKYDPVYARIGSIDAATLGHGLLMWYYTNQANYDQRKIGLEFDLDFDEYGFESVISNFGNAEIYGGRVYYRPLVSSEIPIVSNLEVGASFVTDRDPDGENDTDDDVTEWGLDIGLPILKSETFTTTLYYDFAKFVDFGSGNAIGVDLTMPDFLGLFSLSAKLERRFLGEQFLPNYFNTLYELERVIIEEGTDKRTILENTGKTEGVFGQLAGNIAGKIKLIGSYQRQHGVKNSGILHFEAKMHDLIPDVRLRATYDKTGIETFEDARTLDVRSIATAEIGYRTYSFLIISILYRWNYIYNEEEMVYKPQERIEPRISFSYTF